MRLSVFEADLIIEALTKRAARYDSMALDADISMRRLNRYELRSGAMRHLRDRIAAEKAKNAPMLAEV